MKARRQEKWQPDGGDGWWGKPPRQAAVPAKELWLSLLVGVLGRPPAWITEMPSDTLSEQHVVTVFSLPSLLFIGEALPKIAFFACPKLMGCFPHPSFFFCKYTDKLKNLGTGNAVRRHTSLK